VRDLAIGPAAAPYIGLMHHVDGAEGGRRRLAAAERHDGDFESRPSVDWTVRPTRSSRLLALHAGSPRRTTRDLRHRPLSLNARDGRDYDSSGDDSQQRLRVTDEHAVRETHRHFHDEDHHAIHAAVTAPAILVYGADSVVVTEARAAELGVLRPDIPVVAVRRAGHLVPQENPDDFCAVVSAFVDEAARR
jgi:pimeloyl-ACP methyl ester carboxylesterase